MIDLFASALGISERRVAVKGETFCEAERRARAAGCSDQEAAAVALVLDRRARGLPAIEMSDDDRAITTFVSLLGAALQTIVERLKPAPVAGASTDIIGENSSKPVVKSDYKFLPPNSLGASREAIRRAEQSEAVHPVARRVRTQKAGARITHERGIPTAFASEADWLEFGRQKGVTLTCQADWLDYKRTVGLK